MATVRQKVEALLFISAGPLTAKRLAELAKADAPAVSAALDEIAAEYNQPGRGVQLQRSGTGAKASAQLVTHGDAAPAVRQLVKDETTGDLTKPQLETLTVVAYRGPVTKAELEAIRGVNCSLILRNLLLRGLVEDEYDRKKMENRYRVTMDFMRYLGINETSDLPDFAKLNSEEALASALEKPNVES